MKKQLPFLISLILLISCSSKPGQNQQEQNEASTPTTQPIEKPENSVKSIRAKYESATVYAAATDYYFSTDDGEQIVIRYSHVDLVDNPEIEINLLEPPQEFDGPPGADPALVGTYFQLYKDKSGKVVKISKE